MKKKLTKKQVKQQIENFLNEIENKTPRDIKKIKRLAMAYNIPLKEKRKLFCKNCYSVYRKPEIRIKEGKKIVKCPECGAISRWKI